MADQTSIKVDSADTMREAYRTLSTGEGGTIILESDAPRYEVTLRGGGDAAVTVRSEDADNPSTLSRLNIEHAENITVEGIAFNSVGTASEDDENIRIAGSRNIEVRDSQFRSDASDVNVTVHNKNDVEPGGRVGGISNSEDIAFVDNTASHYKWGLGIFRSDGVEFTGNEFSKIQADGIRMAGNQNVEISGNHFHDFLGWPGNHDDMIQVWGTNAEQLTRNLTISDNILDSGDGVATHGILIRNEEEDGLYENVVVTNNLIHNGHAHGIYLEDVSGARVENNTLIWDQNAMLRTDDISWRPEITIIDAEDSVARDNITSGFWDIDGDVVREGNQIVGYGDPDAANFVGRHFVDALGDEASLSDLRLVEDSAWNGIGADISQAQPSGGPDAPEEVEEEAQEDGAQDEGEQDDAAPDVEAPQEPQPAPAEARDATLSLVDAGTGEVLFDLDGRTIVDADAIAGRSLTAAVETGSDDVASVAFEADGRSQMENVAPYALFGDRSGDYNGGLSVERFATTEISAELFSQARGRGEALGELEASLTRSDGGFFGRDGVTDTFVFDTTTMGRDLIVNFGDEDHLRLLNADLSREELVEQAQSARGQTMLDFGDGNVLHLNGDIDLGGDTLL